MLLTYRSFLSPEDFFDLMIGRFNAEPPEGASQEELTYYNHSIGLVRIQYASLETNSSALMVSR